MNGGKDFLIGGYTAGALTFDALVFGYYGGDKLIYAAHTRNGLGILVRPNFSNRIDVILHELEGSLLVSGHSRLSTRNHNERNQRDPFDH